MTSRRIRKLHLNAPDTTSVRRGAILIEDAFRTASLPEPGGRLLIIRSMSLGVIRTTESSVVVARAIEERLRHLGSSAVYAEDASAPSHPAVYFHNEAEPYVRLAIRLASGHNTDAWFWPLAAAPFRCGMPTDEALRSLLLEAAKTEGVGVVMAAAIVRSLLERGVSDKLFDSLRWLDGQSLLKTTGCSMPEVPIVLFDAPEARVGADVPVQWRESLQKWSSRWGTDDARTLWLAVLALIAEKPARTLDRRLANRAARLVRFITRRTTMRPLFRSMAINDAPASSAKGKQPGLPNDNSPADARADRLVSTQTAAAPGTFDADADRPASIKTIEVRTSPATERSSLAGLGNSSLDDDYVETSCGNTAGSPPNPITRSVYAEAPRFTSHAGMFFLLQVMSRLGLAAALDCNPLLIESDLPTRLLLKVGSRLEAPLDDPMMQALTSCCAENPPALVEFVTPEVWRQGIYNDGPLLGRRVETSPRGRVLFDGSGRLALALWQGEVPIAARRLARDLMVTRGPAIESQAGLELLLDSWLVAMRRWCLRYARIGLRDLVCRAGRVSMTCTHVDVVFDHRHADIRVRKAGLDLDPGWIPWFGRVVSFHYQYGEYADG